MHIESKDPKGALLLTAVICFFMVGLVFFSEVSLGLPISHIMILALIGFLVVLGPYEGYGVFFRLDAIQSILLLLLFVNIAVYVIRIPNIEEIKENYALMTGNRPSGLYPKVALNGVLAILLFWFAYGFGRFSSQYPGLIKKLVGFVIVLCLVNAVANVIGWFIQTGGQIARYNFVPPLVRSAGTSIGYSILGFILLFSMGPYFEFWSKQKRILALLILLFSILIIVTRQAQISFLLLVVTYSAFQRGQITFKTVLRIMLILPIVGFVAFQVATALGFAFLFAEAASSDSVDFLVRVAAFDEAWKIYDRFTLLGAGYGMFALYSELQLFVAGEVVFLASAHNGLASIAGEMGILGFAMILAMIVSVFKIVFGAKVRLKESGFLSALATLTLAFTVINLPLMLISNFYLLPPPSEYTYAATAFFSWYLIGVCAGNVDTGETNVK